MKTMSEASILLRAVENHKRQILLYGLLKDDLADQREITVLPKLQTLAWKATHLD
jgi:hypothetical protein